MAPHSVRKLFLVFWYLIAQCKEVPVLMSTKHLRGATNTCYTRRLLPPQSDKYAVLSATCSAVQRAFLVGCLHASFCYGTLKQNTIAIPRFYYSALKLNNAAFPRFVTPNYSGIFHCIQPRTNEFSWCDYTLSK
jgi:hypothetical protein